MATGTPRVATASVAIVCSRVASCASKAAALAAKEAGIAVVPVSETLPEGEDYVTWMTGNARAVAAALQP